MPIYEESQMINALEERSTLQAKLREVEADIINALVAAQMTEYFTVKWARLYQRTGAVASEELPIRKQRK
jgi:hypothetical protein